MVGRRAVERVLVHFVAKTARHGHARAETIKQHHACNNSTHSQRTTRGVRAHSPPAAWMRARSPGSVGLCLNERHCATPSTDTTSYTHVHIYTIVSLNIRSSLSLCIAVLTSESPTHDVHNFLTTVTQIKQLTGTFAHIEQQPTHTLCELNQPLPCSRQSNLRHRTFSTIHCPTHVVVANNRH